MSHLPDRMVWIHCMCCKGRFEVKVGGSSYCAVCIDGGHTVCEYQQLIKNIKRT